MASGDSREDFPPLNGGRQGTTIKGAYRPPEPGDRMVLCRTDRKVDGEPGDYVLATRRVFTEDEARDFARSISFTRQPLIVKVEATHITTG